LFYGGYYHFNTTVKLEKRYREEGGFEIVKVNHPILRVYVLTL